MTSEPATRSSGVLVGVGAGLPLADCEPLAVGVTLPLRVPLGVELGAAPGLMLPEGEPEAGGVPLGDTVLAPVPLGVPVLLACGEVDANAPAGHAAP